MDEPYEELPLVNPAPEVEWKSYQEKMADHSRRRQEALANLYLIAADTVFGDRLTPEQLEDVRLNILEMFQPFPQPPVEAAMPGRLLNGPPVSVVREQGSIVVRCLDRILELATFADLDTNADGKPERIYFNNSTGGEGISLEGEAMDDALRAVKELWGVDLVALAAEKPGSAGEKEVVG